MTMTRATRLRHPHGLTFSICLLTFAIGTCAGAATTQPTSRSTDAPTLILVLGAEGEPEYGREFTETADLWLNTAKRAAAHTITIGRDPAESPTDHARLQTTLKSELDTNTTTPIWLVLIGHGTFDGRDAKFNLRGPDLSATELADWLSKSRRPLALIDGSSASAPFLAKCAGPHRVVVTATRAGSEIHFARFGKLIAAAIADPAADLDKDGQTSLLEAFLAASHRTEEFYKSAGRLATEHALLDDNGDARGTPATFFQGLRVTAPAKDGTAPDGPRAHQWHLVRSAAEQAMPDDARRQRDALELKLESLRAAKATMPEVEYFARLEPLLIDLARLYRPTPSTAPAANPHPPTQ